MLETLIPLLVPVVQSVFSPDTAKEVTQMAVQNPIATSLVMVPLPGILLELLLRAFPTKKRVSILLGIKRGCQILRLILENVEAALEYVEGKIPQKVK